MKECSLGRLPISYQILKKIVLFFVPHNIWDLQSTIACDTPQGFNKDLLNWLLP